MTPEQIAEGRRLLEAWGSEGLGRPRFLAKAEAFWWFFDNAAALLDAAEDAALYRRLRNPPPGRHEALTVCAYDEALFGECLDEAVRAAIDAERGKR